MNKYKVDQMVKRDVAKFRAKQIKKALAKEVKTNATPQRHNRSKVRKVDSH